MPLSDRVTEQKERRVRRTVAAEWGTGTWHHRFVSLPPGAVETELAGALALGAVMPDRFWGIEVGATLDRDFESSEGVGPEVPRLFEVRERQPGGDAGDVGSSQQALELVYLEIDLSGTYSNGYAETSRHLYRKQYAIVADIWGIALATTSSGIPDPGDKLDGNADNLGGVYGDVYLDTERYPGRVLVHASATQLRAYA